MSRQQAAETARGPLARPARIFWSRVLRPGAGGPWERLANDAGFHEFLVRRLREERRDAEQRNAAGVGTAAARLRGLRLLDELIDGLDHGVLPDETSLQILTTVYAEHPDFRAGWLSPTVTATS